MNQIPEHWPLVEPNRLAEERGRLVRYCTRFTGSDEIAQDLAQEAIVTAWRNRSRLREPEAWQAWLTGITRNVCLRWRRHYFREQSHRAQTLPFGVPEGNTSSGTLDDLPDNLLPDMDSCLERDEIGRLLDRAMTALPERARAVLVDRYIHELSLAEIAARRGIREETANVQLHRSRVALRRILGKPGLREEAAALGVTDPTTAGWQRTSIWCPRCGGERLEGYFGPCKDFGFPEFILSCPKCNSSDEAMVHMFLRPGSAHGSLLDGIHGFKPSLNRILRWWDDFSRTALQSGAAPCLRCGRALPISLRIPDRVGISHLKGMQGERGILALCEPCQSFRFASPEDISFHLPAVREFWKQHPRLRTISRSEYAPSTGPLAITRFESVTQSASIEVVHALQTLKIVNIHRT